MGICITSAKNALTLDILCYRVLGSARKLELASSGFFFAWLRPAASPIKPISPASPSLPGKKIARSRANVGVSRQSLASARPNFVFMFADDLGWGDLRCNGHPRLKTPYLDKMAEDGLLVSNFYVANPVCSPSIPRFDPAFGRAVRTEP